MSISGFKKKVNKKQNKNIKTLSKPVIEENFFDLRKDIHYSH